MEFEWDSRKDAANVRKHGIRFREAAEIFRGFVLVREDTRHDYGERRLIALGEYDGDMIRLIYTERAGNIRSISAWKASSYDREVYEKARPHRPLQEPG